MFWSDLGPAIGYEAIGKVDSSLPTVAIFAKYNPGDEIREPFNEHMTKEDAKIDVEKASKKSPEDITPATITGTVETDPASSVSSEKPADTQDYGKGVVFYMQDDHIVGILLWNVFNRINIARKVLLCEEKFSDLNEVAKLFDIFEQHEAEKKKKE